MIQLERLYKVSVRGTTQVIDMQISGDTYTRSWGQLDGKMQIKSTTATPKNLGRSNATTAEEQALLEAKAVWVKKQKANYSTSPEAPITALLPMKVNEYKKHLKKVATKVFTSPKLNGVNCEFRLLGDGNLELLSRGGEQYAIPPHLEAQAKMLLDILGTTAINGEMYVHGEYLQDIMAAVKKHNDLTPKLSFHVFDFPTVEGDYTTRCTKMYSINDHKQFDAPNFPFVPVWIARSPEEIEDQYEQVMAAGYEGLVIRNPGGLYKYNTRSLDVFKYKKTMDGEYITTSFELDKNSHPVFTCLVDPTKPISGENTFSVKLKGTDEARLAMAKLASTLIGEPLKIEYEMLSKAGKPQKPVGIMFRRIDASGEAVE